MTFDRFSSKLTFLLIVVCSLVAFVSPQANAQQPAGRCISPVYHNSMTIFTDFMMVMDNDPLRRPAPTMIDPSGQVFLRIPSSNPTYQNFFIDWNGILVEINPSGMFAVGQCQFWISIIPQNPYNFRYVPPQMANWGVRGGGTEDAIPIAFANQNIRYVPPLYISEQRARQCAASSGGDTFVNCMLNGMLQPSQQAIYQCATSSSDATSQALCMIGATGDQNTIYAASVVKQCYERVQTNWSQYPLCMASISTDNQDIGRLTACVEKQSADGNVTFFGTAVCYGASRISLTPEQQIAITCAASSGGHPLAFAGCAGGELTQRELTKCFTIGVGGDGCFGPNNEIIKALASVGIRLDDTFGPTNDIVKNWNNTVSDIQHGPGPNNDLVKAFSTIGNDLSHGPGRNNDIVQGINRVIPGFANLFPN